MTGFDRYFKSEPEAARHPKVRFWSQLKNQGAKLVCELHRERNGLSFGPSRLYVSFLNARGVDIQTPDEVDWDSRLNDELLEMGVPAVSDENEIKRFGLVLRDRLEEPEERFGDGFFNSVLIEYLDQSPFADEPAVMEKRKLIHEYRASRDGRSFTDCSEAIEAIVVRCARELMALYKNDQPRATRILAHALASYLDERFSITNSQLLGFASSNGKHRR